MAITAAPYPIVNGVRHDYSSIDIKIGATSYFGIKSLSYNDSLSPGKMYGTGAQKIARTRGQYDASGSIELYRAEADFFISILVQQYGGSLYEASFPITVSYASEGGAAPTADVLTGCRITKTDRSLSAGSDALSLKYDLDIMYIISNGVVPFSGLRK